jgi:hypothetical protein
VSPKLKSLLARVTLAGGVALLGAFLARHAPHEQTIAVRLGARDVRRVEAVVTRRGDDEPTAGFSQDFTAAPPHVVRHTFSAPNGTYIIVITLRELPDADHEGDPEQSAGDHNPNPIETSFERQVSLAGGEVIVSPD